MTTLPSEIVGDAYRSDHAWDLLERLVDIGDRLPGQEGERRAAAVLAGALEDAGLGAVSTSEFEMDGWWRGRSKLEVDGPVRRTFEGQHDLVALPGTPAAEVVGDVVDLGRGTPADFAAHDIDGKVVVAHASDDVPPGYDRRFHRTEKYEWAVDGGAAAFLYATPMEGALPSTGWVGSFDDGAGAIPAAGISAELRSRLVRYAGRGPTTASLSVECRNGRTTSRNVEAVVGPDTADEVLVTAHMDAHDLGEGARDNGTGSAIAVEIGRLLGQMADRLETRVRVLVFGAEEAGHVGARRWIERHGVDGVKAVVNVDGAGQSRTLDVKTHGFESLETLFEDVREEFSIPLATGDGASPFSDHWAFVQRGVPGVMARSAPADDDREWGIGRLWSHTHADTLDKLDRRDVRDLTVPLAAAVAAAAESDRDLPHTSPARFAERLDDGTREMLAVTGRGYSLP
jgi:Zn-dependent M28 family amino/carboxypeptidase